MWWNDPKETQKMEYRLAVQHVENRKKHGLRVETDALRCIVKLAKDQVSDAGEPNDIFHPPSRVLEAIIMISKSEYHDKFHLLMEGLSYLSNVGSSSQAAEFLRYIDTNGIIVDEKVTDLARTVAYLPVDSNLNS
jgi:hypothetical protein